MSRAALERLAHNEEFAAQLRVALGKLPPGEKEFFQSFEPATVLDKQLYLLERDVESPAIF